MGRRKRRERVIITGIAGNLGRRLARQLHRTADVIGIDRRPCKGLPKDITFHQIDLRRKRTADIFRTSKASAVVHLNVMHDPRASQEVLHSFNIRGTSRVLEYCAQYRIPKVVLLSSANVYGPSPQNNQFLSEESPLLAGTHFKEIRSLVELDMLGSTFFWRYPSIEMVILRPVHILGDVRNAPSNYLRLKLPWRLLGFDPMVQVIHVEDVIRAIEAGLKPGIRGIYNIAGPGQVPLSTVFQVLKRPTLPLPLSVAQPLLEALFTYRLTSFPAPELDHIRFVCMVDGSRARQELGFEPAYTMEETIRAIEEPRL